MVLVYSVGYVLDINNGITLQYGFAGGITSSRIITFPMVFSSCKAIVISTINYTTTIGNRQNNTFTVSCTNSTNIDWIAIGWI